MGVVGFFAKKLIKVLHRHVKLTEQRMWMEMRVEDGRWVGVWERGVFSVD